MNSRQYITSETLLDSVSNVLTRRGIDFEVTKHLGKIAIKANISGQKFHKIVLRAKMEKLQEEDKSEIPYVAIPELNDTEVLAEIGSAYVIK